MRDPKGAGVSPSMKPFRAPFHMTMRVAMFAAATIGGLACVQHPPMPNPVAAPPGPPVSLPKVEGLASANVGPMDDGPASAEKWLRKVTVTVPAKGAPEITAVADASRWRGIALPRNVDCGSLPEHFEQRTEIRIKIYWANSQGQVIYSNKMTFPPDWPGVRVPLSLAGAHIEIKVNKLPIRKTPEGVPDLNELARILRDLNARSPMPVIIDARAAVPFRFVLRAIASCLRAGVRTPKFQAPPPPDAGGDDWWWLDESDAPDAKAESVRSASPSTIMECFRREAQRAQRDEYGLPNACVRIRADANAPHRAVQDVMVAAMRAYIWRLSFVGMLDVREVEIGPVYDAPDLPDGRGETPVFIHEEVEVIQDIVEHPVFVHEEVEIVDHMESKNEMSSDTARGQPDKATFGIPLGGTGVVGGLGVGGGGRVTYGFRTGGGRKRAVLMGGGSRASEKAVDAALKWLWRHQEPDGHWEGERKFEAGDPGKNTDAGVTGLAVLAFLGAGHTEKTGLPKYQATVRRAVAWLVKRQAANGAIGAGFDGGLGYHHAIAGLALAEAYGMARVESTGAAAQRAVDYSVNVHQTKHSGWRYKPKTPPDTSVTGWFVAQLKSAKVAGLKVDGRGFQGAIAWLDKCTKLDGERQGLVSYQPERSATPTMTASGMVCRQVMGWKRNDPLLGKGADYLMGNLPKWESGNANFYYWYHGTLAMFQMGGEHWKAWNASLRDMLIERQRRGAPKVDGSWDPVGAWCGSGGRVYATAMGALCLEVYFRYLPLYR